jgi:putative endopeptidase
MRTFLTAMTLFLASAAFGIDIAGMDKSVRPGDDFFGYANGGWLKSTQIPPDRSNYGAFAMITEMVDRRTSDLIQNAGTTNKVGASFAAFMDQESIEKRGTDPIEPQLLEIRKLRTKKELASYLGREIRADVDPLNNTNFHTDRIFGVFVSPAFSDTSKNAAYLLQGGLGMPDRDYYLSNDKAEVALQEKYRQHIAAVLKLAGFDDVEKRAARIYDLEKKIAATHATATESEDVHKANNPWPRDSFPKNAPGMFWPLFFSGSNLDHEATIIVWHPTAVIGISKLVESESLDLWKEYLAFHAVDRMSSYLPKRFDDERFKFYGTALAGIPQQRERWKRAVTAANNQVGEAVGKMYVDKYFPPEAKKKADAMVKNIVAAFGRRIDNLQWMSPATRAKAKAKLATLYVGIGYPEHFRDYTNLLVKRDDAYGNAERAAAFDYRYELQKLGKKPDPNDWWLTPQTVNALNIPLQNALNFPAAILNPPFYDAKADDVENYGAIGSVIGHEISHSFDDQGSQFDAHGNLVNWWTKEDFAHFAEAADRLAKQYDAYEPLPGLHVKGKLTLSENIADVAGLSASYDGYRAAYGNKEAPSANGLSGDQRFFVAFAQEWRNKQRPEALRNQVMTNGHAPSEYRADTVRNLDAWYAAFDVKPGEKLYLAPADRVRVW